MRVILGRKNNKGEADMARDIYRELQKYMDTMSIGYPAVPSGVEIDILKVVFSEDEAEMYMNLKWGVFESPKDIAARINKDPKFVADFIEKMAMDGLLFRIGEGDQAQYMCAPWVIGIYENKLQRATPKFRELTQQYLKEGAFKKFGQVFADSEVFRLVPFGQSVDVLHQISTYEQARDYMKSRSSIAVLRCGCRSQWKGNCDNPEEVCMAFDWYADYMVANKLARKVTLEEALEIHDRCEKLGLASLVDNVKGNMVMCHCCKDCCIAFQSAKLLPRPADVFISLSYAAVNADLCMGCGSCVDICPMNALSMDGAVVKVDLDRCIGCGLCIPTCPTVALSLIRKDQKAEPYEAVEMGGRLAAALEKRGQ